jgi:hypothetical protein
VEATAATEEEEAVVVVAVVEAEAVAAEVEVEVDLRSTEVWTIRTTDSRATMARTRSTNIETHHAVAIQSRPTRLVMFELLG